MENEDVYELQKILSKLGFFHNDEFTNYFGDKIKQAVIDFQNSVGIKADGIVGKDTFYHLNAKLKQIELLEKTNITLQLNDTGENVADLQSKLKELNFYEGEINGIYNETTMISVESFQKSRGLEPTGIAEQKTLLELYTLHNTYVAERNALSRREAANKLVEYAKQFLGVKYVWSGSTPKGFDCSGFTRYIFKAFGVDLEHSASSQFKSGEEVSKSDLQVGDLVFFSTYKPGPSHVGIYIGSNKFIHASSGSKKVVITDLNSSYYSRRYLGARRFNIKQE